MMRFLFVVRVATFVTILLIFLSNRQYIVAALANLIIVIPSPFKGF